MPTVTLNKTVFEKLVGKKLSLENLKDRISMLGTDLEKIEGNDIVVEVFPNRPDMLSEQGFARAFSSFIGVNTGLRKYVVNKSSYSVIVDKSVSSIRPHTVCAVVKNLKYDDEKIREIIQIQEKLHVTFCRNRKKGAIGIYPMEAIKFPIKYLAKKPLEIKFMPLEFPKEINGQQILSQHPAGRAYGHLLEGKSMFPVFIDADGQVLSMPPIINSHKTGKVSMDTRDVFIECSGFDLKTLENCLNIIVCAMADMGGSIYSVDVLYPDDSKFVLKLEPGLWDIDLAYVNKRLGLSLKDKELKELLERMGYGYSKGKVMVPAYRADIMHQIDFVEDIAIAYGYENFVPEIPNVSTIGAEDAFEKFKRYVSEILAGIGMLECDTIHINNEDNLNKKMEVELPFVKLANALNADYSVLRSWITPTVMQIFQENRMHEYPQKIFTIGKVFVKDKSFETGVFEFERISAAICDKDSDYTSIKQVLDYLFRMLGISYSIIEAEHGSFIPGRCGTVIVEGIDVGYIGEISPSVLSNWELEMPVSCFEINLTELHKEVKK